MSPAPLTVTDDLLAAHLAARDALISSEKSRRFDAQRLANLSPSEARAEEIVRALRKQENADVWEVEKDAGERELFPGMHFLTSKATIESTELFKLLHKLPKGALLHAHMDAMYLRCDASFLLKLALSHPCMHISSPSGPLPTSPTEPFPIAPLSSLPSFLAIPSPSSSSIHDPHNPTSIPTINSTMDIFSDAYVKGTYVPLTLARDHHPAGVEVFDEQILRLLTIEPGASYAEYDSPDKIWAKFGSTFLVSRGLLGYEPIFRAYLRELFRLLIADGVSYVETRINFLDATMVAEDGSPLGHVHWLKIYDEVVEQTKKEAQESGEEFWGAKIIYTTVRFIDNDALRLAMEDCLSLKQRFPHLIAGFDLVGHEDSLRSLASYLPELLWFQTRQAEAGVDIPYIFHAGETLGDGDAVDHNLFDAILLGTKRIGHGFSLSRHPLLMELVRDRKICIECCPISSEILRYTPSILNHPLQTMLNYGVPVALSSDDPQIFGNLGLTFDFYQVLLGSESTGLISLGVLARQSIDHSLMEPELKARSLAAWDKRWAHFVEDIVSRVN